ncbi:tetraspanin-8-like [Synchiropus splendidus]|uniref:tetraspanin-8-like n=1 Tax=Synchiropus splendidus TaxID=270530 RepID=UPI00237D85E7|nr:tetraspanin-8-like [Synchiropus splendidus]
MGKINPCMKICFVILNAAIAAFGCLAVAGLLKNGSLAAQSGSTLLLTWIYVICTVVIGAVGLHAGRKENVLGLKIFAGLIMVGLMANLVLGLIVVVGRAQVYRTFQDSENARLLLQDHSMRNDIIQLQITEDCCGLASASDWGVNIPDSCSCFGYGSECIDAPMGSEGPSRVYKKTCGSLIASALNPMFEASLGISFGMASVCLLGFIMSLMMIKQVQRCANLGP